MFRDREFFLSIAGIYIYICKAVLLSACLQVAGPYTAKDKVATLTAETNYLEIAGATSVRVFQDCSTAEKRCEFPLVGA